MSTIRLAGFEKESMVDGPGIRNVIFLQGCANHCPSCHNPETWDPTGGTEYQMEDVLQLLEQWKQENPLLDGITFSGGDPLFFLSGFKLDYQRMHNVFRLVEKAHQLFNGNVILYTGYGITRILSSACFREQPECRKIIYLSRYLITEPFEQHFRSVELSFRGSSNQHIVSVYPTNSKSYLLPKWDYLTFDFEWDQGLFAETDKRLQEVAAFKFTGVKDYGFARDLD